MEKINLFFRENNFINITTPPMVKNPGMEIHIHPFQIRSLIEKKNKELFLHTSPEFYMKEVLSEINKDIYTICYSFRDEPFSSTHQPQFLMLEWYRVNSFYEKIMNDCEKLISFILNKKTAFTRKTVDEIFLEFTSIEISNYLDLDSIKNLIQKKFPHLSKSSENLKLWEDYFFLIFLNEIEPKLVKYPFLILFEYPFHLNALSTIKPDNKKVCERFEMYINGIEIANCFNELVDLKIQKERFFKDAKKKESLYGYTLPEPDILYKSLERGIQPCSGIALGIERLYGQLFNIENPFWPNQS